MKCASIFPAAKSGCARIRRCRNRIPFKKIGSFLPAQTSKVGYMVGCSSNSPLGSLSGSDLIMTSRKVQATIQVVAVGTTIADRPPHRSVQARLRIRLLPRMSSGEASIRIGMQNAGLRNPPEQERGETIPSHLCALTATN
jgi:hypothetical protein